MARSARRLGTLAVVPLLVGAGLAGLFATPAQAATFGPVTTYSELFDAITDANAAFGEDTIVLGADIPLAGSLPTILDDLVIDGGGYTINGANTWGLAVATASLTISDLTIENAATGIQAVVSNLDLTNVSVIDGVGTGISHLASWGAMRLEGVTLDRNDGHGLEAHLFGTAALTVIGGSISDNDGFGVSIYTESSGAIELSELAINRNGLPANNLGLFISGSGSGDVTVENVETSGNGSTGSYIDNRNSSSLTTVRGLTTSGNTGNGDGLYTMIASGQTATIEDVLAEGNGNFGLRLGVVGLGPGTFEISRVQAVDNPEGGLLVGGSGLDVTIEDSSFTGSLNGPGLYFQFSSSELTVSNSTVSGNYRGVFSDVNSSDLSFVNSTISGNGTDLHSGASIFGDQSSTFELLHSTVTGNTGDYPAVYIIGGPATTISHSIIAGNDYDWGGDLYFSGSAGSIATIEYSIIGEIEFDGGYTPISESEAAASGTLLGVDDPGLGPLADNGGLTFTHLLLATSPALDAGDPDIAGAPATDQRGAARIQGTAIDIGAVELAPAAEILPPTGGKPGTVGTVALVLLLGGLALLGVRAARYRTA